MQRQSHRTPWIALALMVVIGTTAVSGAVHVAAQSGAVDTPPVMPRYDEDGGLLLPDDYLRWTFAGASLGLSYNDEPPQRESFNHTLIEPTAYDHFVRTGEFREGTMLVLLVRSTEADAMPARHGRFASDVLAVELAVKDKERVRGRLGVLRLRRRQQRPDYRATAAARQPLLRLPHRSRGARQRFPAVLPAAGRRGRRHGRLTWGRKSYEKHEPARHCLAARSFPLTIPARELIVAGSPSRSNNPNSPASSALTSDQEAPVSSSARTDTPSNWTWTWILAVVEG